MFDYITWRVVLSVWEVLVIVVEVGMAVCRGGDILHDVTMPKRRSLVFNI